MRIGLVMFGHLRSFRSTYDSYQHFLNVLRQSGDVNVFCHTWDIEESVTASWWKEQTSNAPPPPTVDAGEIKNKYQPALYNIEPSKQFDDAGYQLNSSIPVAGILSMLYSQYRSFQLLREYEKQNNIRYDVVIKARYDLLFEVTPLFSSIIERAMNERCCFLPTSNPYEQAGSFSDVFVAGHRDLADDYFNFYENFRGAVKNYERAGYRKFLPELCLTTYLQQKNLPVNELAELRIHILRKSGEKFQINSDKNFQWNNPHCFHRKTREAIDDLLPAASDIGKKNTRYLVKKYIGWIYPLADEGLLNSYADFFEGKKIPPGNIFALAKRTKGNKLFTRYIMRDFFETAFRAGQYGFTRKFVLATSLMLYTDYGTFFFRVLKRELSEK
jgi:hypothetical protein